MPRYFSTRKYINNGVILFNMKAFRDKKFVDKFYSLIEKYHFDNIDPDQAYMNEICEDKIYHLPLEWDAMPNEHMDEIKNPKIVHYNLFLSLGISQMFNMANTSGMLLKSLHIMEN